MENQFSCLHNDPDAVDAYSGQPLALILADHDSAQLGNLVSHRSKAALPFAGEYRLIDFALSNCVHSGIDTVGVITQYQSRSLHDHLAYGRPWDLDRRQGGLALLHPYQGHSGMQWYSGAADAIYQNQDFILRHRTGEVLLLAGDQAYKQDLNVPLVRHRQAGADLTVVATAIEPERAAQYYTLQINELGWVQALLPPGSNEPGSLALMGILLFNTDVLNWRLNEDAQDANSTHQFDHDVIPCMIRAGDRVLAFQYTDYWNCIHTVEDYWQASIDLLRDASPLNLHDTGWPIRTQVQARPPTRIEIGGHVSHSLISGGCIIEGAVEYSILSPGVYVGPGAVVRNSIVMQDVVIEERALVQNAILDIEATVGQQAQVGIATRHAPTMTAQAPTPITVIEKGAHIHTGVVVGQEYPRELVPSRRQARVDAT
ncbi:MAG: glucose-1-phosphate adenylyltransferase [Anaerolineae bacterium]|nr:glucose-1-phosphate adenylyltransferase [Anaerolineae bacterium]